MSPSQVMTHISMAEMRGTSLEDLTRMLSNEDLSQGDEFGSYPIHEIATVKRDLVDFAVERGADVNVRNGEGYTALEIAIARGHTSIVKVCLEHAAEIETRDRYGKTPLISAVLAGKKAFEIVDLLLDADANPDTSNKNGLSARVLADEDNHPSKGRM